jgi:hypothetical protein
VPSSARLRSVAAALAASSLVAGAACDGAVTLTIASDRAVPGELDGFCVGVTDRDLGGGRFGRRYRLAPPLDGLPQTLALEPGAADAAWVWAVGTRAGVPVVDGAVAVDFARDVAVRLDRCPAARAGAIELSTVAGPGGALAVASRGPGGTLAVAVAADRAAVVDVRGGALTLEELPGVGGDAVVAADLDGDCADDLAVARGGVVELWWRAGRGFTRGPDLPGAADALAAADVDGDGDLDLATGVGATLTLWRGDGVGGFAVAAGGLDPRGAVTAVTALAFGDLDRDGHADLLVGQGGGPVVALLGDPAGAGVLTAAPGAVPATPRAVAALTLGDLDGDGADDAVVAVVSAPPRVLINRGGRLEDQSFVRLPDSLGPTVGVALGDWSGDCAADLIAAGPTSAALVGADGGLGAEATWPAATAALALDLDDDGAVDRLVVGPDGAAWGRR